MDSIRAHAEPTWLDADAGPLVRPYALTAGRTRPVRGDLDLITVLVAVRPPSILDGGLGSECAQIIALCQQPQSVAEIAAHLTLPTRIVRVLLSDLLDRTLLRRNNPLRATQLPTEETFRAVLNGLRSL
ncbi:hypothetical protein Rhe02_21540 [Rhizocola hellebori]|uniref:DUF742 domain-containing protein n=1 Tax=Rhizocola hellebori TaxID=1392758 RepID=A0A8J3Q6B5_9ACTN|nr:DUF742 domain-containing protein [Rhizocola hellebori]GIH04087.1 hypothetical protein Rhe02_21540 [Rhizocola hellebori]